MNIGRQIQTLRKQKGITQEALAAEMGVTVGAVSKWENGMTLPDIQMLCSLADYFEVTRDELLGRARKGTFMVCDDAELIRTVLKDIMEKEGYLCVGLAEDGARLHVLFDETIPDILFLDVHLATESGLDLLKEVKVDELVVKYADSIEWKSLHEIAPFASRQILEQIADRKAEAGEYGVIKEYLPFLARETVVRLALKI